MRALFVVCSHTHPLHSLQESFALKILASGKPCVVVLINGGAVSIDSLVEPAPAIIEGFYPGVNGAQVLASAIFGDVNEFGRLPYTIYPSVYASQVDMNNMSMQVRLHTLAVCDVQCAMCSVYVDGLMDGLHGGYTHCAAGAHVSLCVCVFTGGSRTDVSVLHGCVFVYAGEMVAMVDGTRVSVRTSGGVLHHTCLMPVVLHGVLVGVWSWRQAPRCSPSARA